MVPPAERHYPTAAVIPDFRGQTWESLQGLPEIGPPACSDSGFQVVNLGIAAEITRDWPSCVQRFWISWGKLGNRCKECPGLALLRAVIRYFRGQTWESLQDFPQKQS